MKRALKVCLKKDINYGGLFFSFVSQNVNYLEGRGMNNWINEDKKMKVFWRMWMIKLCVCVFLALVRT